MNYSTLELEYLSCNTIEHQQILHKVCLNMTARKLFDIDCVPNMDRLGVSDANRKLFYPLRISLGIWCIFAAVVGILGNILTLLALPFARSNRRHRVDEIWNTSTIFILHLAVVDLMFCIISIPSFSIAFLSQGWEYGNMPCDGKYMYFLNSVDIQIMCVKLMIESI